MGSPPLFDEAVYKNIETIVLSVDGGNGGGERRSAAGVLQGDTFRPDAAITMQTSQH